MQKYAAVSQGKLSIESLKKKWIDNLDIPCTSKLVETVGRLFPLLLHVIQEVSAFCKSGNICNIFIRE